jgi:hypothetical protein
MNCDTHYGESYSAECCIAILLSNVTLNVILLSVVMLNVILLSKVRLCVILLSFV